MYTPQRIVVPDLMTDVGVLFGLKMSDKPIDKCHGYGHGKIETLVSLMLGLILFFVGWKIFLHGGLNIIKVIRGSNLGRPGWIAFYTAIISIVSKEWLYQRTVSIGRKIKSQALIANAWHHRTDALSSIGVAIGVGGAILLGEDFRILDPIAAVIISLFIVRVAFLIFLNSANELIEASLDDKTNEEILDIVKSVNGAQIPHNLKTRRIGKGIAVDIHIKVDETLSITAAHDIATDVEGKLKDRFGHGTFVTVHVEPLKDL